jgi:predicted nucleic acid-binding protein
MLADTGPLVALLDRRDPDHKRVTAVLRTARAPMLTTYAVLTEALHLLPRHAGFALLQMVENGGLRIVELGENGLKRSIELMRRYDDVPMDFADATLVALAEATGIRTIVSLDFDDFETYRLADRRALQNLISRN